MARNAYEDDLLTDAQRIQESYRIAPGGGVDVGNRLRNDVALTASANALENPLLAPRGSMGREAVTASQAPVSAVPNPMVRSQIQPPVPRHMMGVEQQVAWQRLQDEQEQNQMAREAALLKAEADRRTMELQRQETTQSTAMMSELPRLQEALLKGDDDEYLAVKADLVSRYPVGAGSVEAARVLKAFDDRYGKKESAKADIDKARIARQEAAKQRREETVLKQAWEQGPEVAREVAARMADPLKGVDDASVLLAQVQEKSTTRALLDAGLSKEVIAQRYGGEGTGRPFDYQAARAAPKSRAFLTAERNKIGNEVLAMEKMRKTLTDVGEDWDETHQQIYDDKLAQWRELTPQIGDRAGVQGMATKYVPYERTLNPAARVAATTRAVTQAPAKSREKTYRNPTTGKRIAFRNGKWEEI